METERKSQKRVREGENYRSLCHCLLMSWKPADHIALAGTVQRTQTLRHGISSMWEGLCGYVTAQKKGKESGNKQTKKMSEESQTGCFFTNRWIKACKRLSEREKTKRREGGMEGGRLPEDDDGVGLLSVLTVQSLPPRIKGREVAWLSAALSHVKPRRRPYTCSHK